MSASVLGSRAMSWRLRLLLLVSLAVLSCKGCGEDAPQPPSGPDPVVRWYAHLGRPTASVSLLGTLIQGPLDVRALMLMAVDIPAVVYEQVDLMQPADLMQLEAEGGHHTFAIYAAAPSAFEELEKKAQLDTVMPGQHRIHIDGQTRCMLMDQRIVCADSPRGMGSTVLFATRRADKWKADRTDAVVELDGAVLREDLPPAPLQKLLETVLVRLRGSTGESLLPPLPDPKVDLAAWFAGVDRIALRVRLTARNAIIDARIDSRPDAIGAIPAVTRAVAKAKPIRDAVTTLPLDANMALAFGGATPPGLRRLLADAIAAPLAGHESAAALRDQLAALWAATGGAYAVAQRTGEIVELHGLHDPAAASAALAALTARRIEAGEQDVLVSAIDGGVVIAVGEVAYVIGLVGERLIVIAGRKVEASLAELKARSEGPPVGPFGQMAQKPLVLSADLGTLFARERARLELTWSEGVPDADELRAAVTLELWGSTVRLGHGILQGTVSPTVPADDAIEAGVTAP